MNELEAQDEINTEGQEIQRELGEKVGEAGETTDDVLTTNDVGASLDLRQPTREGGLAVKAALESARRSLEEQQGTEKQEFDGKAEHGKEREGALGQRSRYTERDAASIDEAVGRFKSGKGGGQAELRAAAEAGREDSRWLDNEVDGRRQDRERSTEEIRALIDKVRSSPLQTNI